MCGIAGIIDFTGRPVDEGVLREFCGSLAHRGPDDTGIWARAEAGFSVGLAHTRLAVIDPSPDGHQPMTDPTGRHAICYNGELYNHRALAGELSGHLRTHCDTEVALNACMQWGPAALERFDAMWAMAFVDTATRQGHLSRDPFGIKPLYYTRQHNRLIFASELKILRNCPGIDLAICHEAVDLYLNLGFIPHPYTIYNNVFKLPPGHRLDFDRDGPVEPVALHSLPTPADVSHVPYDEATRRVRDLVEQAVLSQRVADVPLGAFLSGGLDSAIVVACLARAGGERVKTFSIGYAEHPRYDETGHAEHVARHFNTNHHAFHLTFHDVLATVEPILDHLGEPFGDSSLLPTALVSRHTRRHVTVALSGDGGDELFGGYWRYLGHHYLRRYHRMPAMIRRGLIEPLLNHLPDARTTPWLDRARQLRKLLRGQSEDPLGRHVAWSRITTDNVARDLIGPARAAEARERLRSLYESAAPELHPQDELGRILRADLKLTLPGDMLFKVDTASMAHSLEVRVPLLSRDLVEFVTALPIDYRISATRTKRILRDAFRDVLPESILHRKKMGFEVPVGEFLRHELRDMFNDVVTPATLDAFGIDSQAVSRFHDQHTRRRADHTELLWSLLVLCKWHQ